jgi:hypothetical protein
VHWGITLIIAFAGIAAGAVSRLILARLRRGARIRTGPCEAACGLLCAVVAWRWAAGGVVSRA